jgi:hypothetical protein
MATYFSEHFQVRRSVLAKYGAFNVSLVTDLPLFIDPFLLFNSRKRKYRDLHDRIIEYLRFLRDKAEEGSIAPGLLRAWYRFPEVKQTWLGFTRRGNRGSGLGGNFAVALHGNLHRIFTDFGSEKVTKGSHLEKLCLIRDRVGRDNISDFTTNLIKGYLCDYTREFARRNLSRENRRVVSVPKVRFNYDTETWESERFELPWANGDYVLLTPRDILAKDDTWINRTDLIRDFERLPDSIPNDELRGQVNNYFLRALGRNRKREPTKEEQDRAAAQTILQFPQLIDIYIRYKEDHGDKAESISAERVDYSTRLYVDQFRTLRESLKRAGFYDISGDSHEEAHRRVAFLKDVIENKGGHRLFYVDGHPIEREEDIQIMYRLTWYATESDVSREVNDGRGPADFKVSRGSKDKTIVEFKLAKNTQLKRNLEHQVEIYKKASDAKRGIKVIVYFSAAERKRVAGILKELKLTDDRDIVLVDARNDNKPSGSKA